VLLQGLSTGHQIGLGLAVAIFAGFSLIVSMVVPHWRPQFPGRGLPVFLAVIVLLFLGMLVAVENFGKESEEAKAGGEATTTETTATTETRATTETKPSSRTVKVSETEFKIKLPESSLPAGAYTFDVENDGKIAHDLVVKGQGVDEATKTIDGGDSTSLTVDLKPGTYDLYCSVPGHKQAGMDLKLTVS
jgi:uncharacterized cupredoxin-like copper-binding protein